MPIFEITQSAIRKLSQTTFSAAGVRERADLQRLLRSNVEVVSPDTLVIAEEFGEWEDSRRRIDLLGLDRDANLVVIELKRTEDGGHMELQAIRYAAMVSTLTFEKVVEVYTAYLRRIGKEDDARTTILEFLGWEGPDEDVFAQDVRIVLASAEFSKELTTAVMWLNEHGLDIRCVRMVPVPRSASSIGSREPSSLGHRHTTGGCDGQHEARCDEGSLLAGRHPAAGRQRIVGPRVLSTAPAQRAVVL